ncbi:MAG: NADPH-dependent F420 reductase [Bacteroidota bacterium]
MKIGILGTGAVGKALGTGFVNLGHDVKMGSRDSNNEKLKEWVKKSGVHASGGTFAETAKFGEAIIIATLWVGTENALNLAGPENFRGKVVIDATNPLDFSSGKGPKLAVGHTDSGGEQIQRWLPGANVVKAFNIVGNAHMVNPQFPGGPPDMFICGNDAGAKKVVIDILKEFGWPAIDIGGIEGARLLEPMCILWVLYGGKTRQWNHAFKMLRK